VNQHRAVGFTVAVATATASGLPGRSRRAGLSPEAPPFGRLAASQVGYGPSMLKQFSSLRADQNRNPEA
jgi:hypothetical protein